MFSNQKLISFFFLMVKKRKIVNLKNVEPSISFKAKKKIKKKYKTYEYSEVKTCSLY